MEQKQLFEKFSGCKNECYFKNKKLASLLNNGNLSTYLWWNLLNFQTSISSIYEIMVNWPYDSIKSRSYYWISSLLSFMHKKVFHNCLLKASSREPSLSIRTQKVYRSWKYQFPKLQDNNLLVYERIFLKEIFNRIFMIAVSVSYNSREIFLHTQR